MTDARTELRRYMTSADADRLYAAISSETLRTAADEIDDAELPDDVADSDARAFDDGAAWATDLLRQRAEKAATAGASTAPRITTIRVSGTRVDWREGQARRRRTLPSVGEARRFREYLRGVARGGDAG
ncbi:hypothetical protein [Streptomyces jumonjinensis]|uniref:Uncharacterized protein n=1 Tax=Streptomyces jumonjinensis TaxID=1945 RepID=A0A646KLK5_STRJU|nr:hypothetical protein [Streptomyces jumonjinensis]MQT03123.1 hypothetical protein [Streptomyces jumonjinensis]